MSGPLTSASAAFVAKNSRIPPYVIEQSLRFDGSSYLSLGTGTTHTTTNYTISFWFKMNKPNSGAGDVTIFNTMGNNNTETAIKNAYDWNAIGVDKLGSYWHQTNTGNNYNGGNTLAVYRDPSAWYHVVCAIDTTQAAAADRCKYFVNGVLQELDPASYSSPIPQNYSPVFRNFEHRIGQSAEWYLAEYHLTTDGTKAATDFGEYDNNGVWRPIKYTGSYGTFGFYLKFDPTATNGIGHDHSGNGLHWTANGFFNEIGTPDYNANWIGSTSGSYYSGSWENVFNGNVTVYTDYVYAYGNTATLTFSTPLTGVIEVFGSDGGAGDNSSSGSISLSDGSSWSINSVARANAQWHSFGSKSNITTITVSSPGGHGAMLGAIRVDGDLLVNESAKAGYDNFSDTPTTNWCTLNPLKLGANVTLGDGNLVATMTSTNVRWNGTIAMSPGSGKYYAEMTVTQSNGYGSIGLSSIDDPATGELLKAYRGVSGTYDSTAYGNSYTTGDIIGIAYDAINGALYFSKNGTFQNSGDPTSGATATGAAETGLTGTYVVGGGIYGGSTGIYTLNFGQRDFAYTPPSGFLPLNTSNLPAPTVKDGSDNFNTVTYTGSVTDTSTQAVTGVGFQSDWTWIKRRDGANSHQLVDAVRGTGNWLESNSTNSEASTNTNGVLTSFNSDGFTLTGGSTNANLCCESGFTYVAWNWLAGNGTSSNTNGSITSTVSVNATAGFSIVSYTGTGSAATVGHGLGVAPSFIIAKNRDSTSNWDVYHTGLTSASYRVQLNSTGAQSVSSGSWNGTDPTSTVFSVKDDTATNSSNADHIAYCFAEVEGYSKISSYTANASTDGPFIHCGFKPALIIFKNTSTTEAWSIFDAARNDYNGPDAKMLLPSSSAAEATSASRDIDFLSNGFKLRVASGNNPNTNSGNVYIFAAFAENPFGGSGVSPATAR